METEVADKTEVFLNDAFPHGLVTLLTTPPGPEKEAILLPLCRNALAAGTSVSLTLSTIPPRRILRRLASPEVDPHKSLEDGQLKVLDWYSHKEEDVQESSEENGIIRCAGDLRSLDGALSRMLKASKGKGLSVVEVFTDLLGGSKGRVSQFASVLGKKLRRAFETTVLAVDSDLVAEVALESLQGMADCWTTVTRDRDQDGISWTVVVRREEKESSYILRSEAPFTEFEVVTAESTSEGVSDLMDLSEESCPQCGTLIEEEECPVCGYAPGDDQLWKAKELYQKAEERLKENPTDVQALFTKAAALAKMDDYREAINVLNELTINDPRYPGMWMLKAKLYDRLGEQAKANLCRQRALNIRRKEGGTIVDATAVSEGEEFQCPLCQRSLPWNATICSCGAEFVEEEAEPEGAVPRQ